jgi:hypothetical protein
MILFLFRMLGFLFLSAAFVFAVHDGTRSIADDAFLYTKVAEFWTSLHAASLQRFQLLIQGNPARWLWEPVAVTVLNAPTFVAFGVRRRDIFFTGRQK